MLASQEWSQGKTFNKPNKQLQFERCSPMLLSAEHFGLNLSSFNHHEKKIYSRRVVTYGKCCTMVFWGFFCISLAIKG